MTARGAGAVGGLGRPLDAAICDLLLGHILAHAEEPDADALLEQAASEFERLGVASPRPTGRAALV